MLQQKTSMNEQDYEQLTLFQEDSPVRMFQSQEKKLALLIKMAISQEVGYGLKCLELSEKLNQYGLLQKTWPDYFQTMKEELSPQLLKDWKIQSTKSFRYYLQHVTMVHLLRGKEFSSLPRPRVADTEGAPVKNSVLYCGSWSRENKKGVRYGVKLKDVLYKLYGLKRPSPKIYEAIMGFPIGWTDLNA